MADYLAEVGRRLREARERNRPDLSSHDKAARELENYGVVVTGKQYGRWERGESEPRGNKRDKLAEMLGTTKEAIWGKPPLAPEEELREQLDRIEQHVHRIDEMLRLLGAELLPLDEVDEVVRGYFQARSESPDERREPGQEGSAGG